eukprot:11191726-Lingulodinium_polyedra.AAC.1
MSAGGPAVPFANGGLVGHRIIGRGPLHTRHELTLPQFPLHLPRRDWKHFKRPSGVRGEDPLFHEVLLLPLP